MAEERGFTISLSVWLCFTRLIVRGEELILRTGLIVFFKRFCCGKRALFLAKKSPFWSTDIFCKIFGEMKCLTSAEALAFRQASVTLVKYLTEEVVKMVEMDTFLRVGHEFGHVTKLSMFLSIGGNVLRRFELPVLSPFSS